MTATTVLSGSHVSVSPDADIISQFVVQRFSSQTGPLNFLEAGCGKSWALKLPGLVYRVTGVDNSREALEIRKNKIGDLDEAIYGDLRTIDLKSRHYDMVYCSFVLEHVDEAQQVLDRLLACLKPKGLLILLIPDRDTVYGFITRMTPFWFHVMYYRYIRKKPNAGKFGSAPFPTYYHPVVSMKGIRAYMAAQGHTICVEKKYDIPFKKLFGSFSGFVIFLFNAIGLMSRNKLATKHNNLLYIIEKTSR